MGMTIRIINKTKSNWMVMILGKHDVKKAVVGHGVSDDVVTNLLDTSRAFFDLPTEIKLQSKTNNERKYPKIMTITTW